MKTEIVILGGGVIGASCAYELSKAGHSVILFENRHFASGASGASAAMLETQIDFHRGEPFVSLGWKSQQLFPALHTELKELTGIDFEYDKCGILQVAFSHDDTTFLKQTIKDQNEKGFNAKWLDPQDLQKEIPKLNPQIRGGAYYADDGQVDGLKLTQAYLKGAELNGAKLINQSGEIKVKKDNSQWVVQTQNDSLVCGKLILASGAWTDHVLSQVGFRLGTKPIRGQLLFFETPEHFLPYPIYTTDQGYITPKKKVTIVGSTIEYVDFDESITEEALINLKKKGFNLIPSLKERPFIKQTAAIRPGSVDDLPYLGPLPDEPHLLVAAGHFRNGILLAPVTGQIMTKLVENTDPGIDLSPFSTERAHLKVN